jgi:hypothetical protein
VTSAAAGEPGRFACARVGTARVSVIRYILNHGDRQAVFTLFPALQKTFGFRDTVSAQASEVPRRLSAVCDEVDSGILSLHELAPQPLFQTIGPPPQRYGFAL